ncbi:MAG: GNAT family N-acetyltransferase [Clostridia bacterium]|nr:GNAT family N-acetyltransferase [Clostridia bacterium]
MKRIYAKIDRPLGSYHPRHPDMYYPVNYGYVPGVMAGDGAEQDVYVLGVNEPLADFTGELIAIVHRRDDVEDKWVLAPEGMRFTAEEIMAQVRFQEQYFDAYVVVGAPMIPLTFVRADETMEEAVLGLRMDCLRAVCGEADMSFSDAFMAATRDFLRTADQTTMIVLDGETPVACATLCYVHYIPTPSHPTGRRAHLMNVYTASTHRRRGIARRLLQLLQREAEGRGVTEISLDATDSGRSLYEALGYLASSEAMKLDIAGSPGGTGCPGGIGSPGGWR